ncbi:MAG: 4Fe-4S dicluster domain-containing protein [Bryobacteraceae bacterium]
MATNTAKQSRYGMVIDLDRCTGCGACMVACAVENNVPPARPEATPRTGITWLRVYQIENRQPVPESRSAFIPMLCQQCGQDTPCASVCPQQAVEADPRTGIVDQMPQRCLGCRYCMAACPYHARYFNWWDPVWPKGMEKTLNPDVATRMRGVVEKCNFCHGRLHRAQAQAAAEGRRDIRPEEYVPACVESCPAGAMVFGDLAEERSEPAKMIRKGGTVRLLESLGTGPKIYYKTNREWLREIAARGAPGNGPGVHAGKEQANG